MTNFIRLCGKKASESVYNRVKQQIHTLKLNNFIPGLAVIQIGNRKDSTTYVNHKATTCTKYGIKSEIIKLPVDTSESNVLSVIEKLNKNPDIHGILVQLPLPENLNTNIILNTIDEKKDVDCFTNKNVGRLILNDNPLFKPCTPAGCLELLKYYNINVEGKDVVVIGNSRIVGMPLSHMLLQMGATVSVCHIKTNSVKKYTETADIVFSACGVKHLVTDDMVKDNAIIIDIGINAVPINNSINKYKLVGDVDYENVKEKAQAITPVPGGIGPMTISMLLNNTVQAANNFYLNATSQT